jgi:hypothetical protein
MNETIEQTILRILGQVSEGEKLRNRSLETRTARVLKALAYLKAASSNKKMGA